MEMRSVSILMCGIRSAYFPFGFRFNVFGNECFFPKCLQLCCNAVLVIMYFLAFVPIMDTANQQHHHHQLHDMTVSVNHAQASIATTCASSSAVVAIAMARPISPCNSSGSEADGSGGMGSNSTTAMRRMHFKSARNARNAQRGPNAVPKVTCSYKRQSVVLW